MKKYGGLGDHGSPESAPADTPGFSPTFGDQCGANAEGDDKEQFMPLASPEEDGPGNYTITNLSAVKQTEVLDSPKIASLEAGTRIRVVELVNLQAQQRLRGRLEHPDGWISLLNTETGFRWAVRDGSKAAQALAQGKKSGKLKLPKSLRHAAGKAAKESKKAVKGASKAAVAVSQKLGVQEGAQRKYQATAELDAETIGACALEEEEEEELFDDAGADAGHRSDGSGAGRGDARAKGSTKTKAKDKAKAKGSQAAPEPSWDPSSFKGKPRPLQCGSIWDIPTSRFPEPEARPPPKAKKPSASERDAPKPATSGGARAPVQEGGERCHCRCHIL